MKRIYIVIGTLIVCSLALSACHKSDSPVDIEEEKGYEFVADSWSYGDKTIYYQKLSQNPEYKYSRPVVFYLHGDSYKGADNLRQLNDPAVAQIAEFLFKKDWDGWVLPFTLIVPQCPSSSNWDDNDMVELLARMTFEIKNELRSTIHTAILGGGEGGRAIWKLCVNPLNTLELAMPVGASPVGLSYEDFSRKHGGYICAVASQDDFTVNTTDIKDFLDGVKSKFPKTFEYRLDIENNVSPETLCRNAYTEERLDWLLSPYIYLIGSGVDE